MTDRRTTLVTAGAAAAVVLLSLITYAARVPGDVGLGDAAEAQAVPYLLGIAHPVGFPLYTLAGWIFSHALIAGTVAWRLNFFIAVCTALSAGGVVLLGMAAGANVIAASAAALAYAFGGLVWAGAMHANTQVLASALSVFALAACVRFARNGEPPMLLAACLLCGLGMATHPMAVWTLPAIAVAAIWQRARLTRRIAFGAVCAVLLPLAFYAYLPIRSNVIAARHLNPGAVLGSAGTVLYDTNETRTFDGFLREVLAPREGAAGRVADSLDPHTLPEAVALWYELMTREYTVALLACAALGLLALAGADRRTLSVLGISAVGIALFTYSYRADANLERYGVVSAAVVAAVAAASSRLALPRLPAQAPGIAAAIALIVIAAVARATGEPANPHFPNGESDVRFVREHTPDDAIIVAAWPQATAVAYAAYVEHRLGRRLVVSGWPAQYRADYPRWAQQRPVYIFAGYLQLRRVWPRVTRRR